MLQRTRARVLTATLPVLALGLLASGCSEATEKKTTVQANRLVFTTSPPTNTAAGGVINPAIVVEVQRPDGSVVLSASDPVSLSLINNSTGASLSGSLTETPVDGVATFSNVQVNRAGSGYTLLAS